MENLIEMEVEYAAFAIKSPVRPSAALERKVARDVVGMMVEHSLAEIRCDTISAKEVEISIEPLPLTSFTEALQHEVVEQCGSILKRYKISGFCARLPDPVIAKWEAHRKSLN